MTTWLGIDFSGSAKQWGPSVSRSNIWIAEVHGQPHDLKLVDICRVQALPGSGHPFDRLAARLARGDFQAVGIDAPLSLPAHVVPDASHEALLRLVNSLPTDGHPFPSGATMLGALSLSPSEPLKPLRVCEQGWQRRRVNVRSTLWNGPRGGAPFTSAALKLLALAQCPVWPFADAAATGLIAEAFPAAQLSEWGINAAGYSKPNGTDARGRIVARLTNVIDLGTHRSTLEEDAEAIDAVLCAFAAIAVTENRLAVLPGTLSNVEGWIAVHDSGTTRAEPPTWDAVLERFAQFLAQPCLKASGPDFDRGEASDWLPALKRNSSRFLRFLPETPGQVTQDHIDSILTELEHDGTRTAGKRPSASLWKHLWRAIILERADYRCHFCARSAEEGLELPSGHRVALRLELDHISPRANGGDDFLLTNIRATCRTCNVARGRMVDEDFVAELKSLAAAVARR